MDHSESLDPAVDEMNRIIEEEQQLESQRVAKHNQLVDRIREFIRLSKGAKESGGDVTGKVVGHDAE